MICYQLFIRVFLSFSPPPIHRALLQSFIELRSQIGDPVPEDILKSSVAPLLQSMDAKYVCNYNLANISILSPNNFVSYFKYFTSINYIRYGNQAVIAIRLLIEGIQYNGAASFRFALRISKG